MSPKKGGKGRRPKPRPQQARPPRPPGLEQAAPQVEVEAPVAPEPAVEAPRPVPRPMPAPDALSPALPEARAAALPEPALEAPAPEVGAEPAATPPPHLRGLLRPRLRRVDLAVAALLGLLGFGVAVQVRSTQDDGLLASARQEDLVRILDDLSNRSDRLRRETATLSATRERLTSGSDRDRAALEEARRRAQVLGVLAGTVPAEGTGIVLTLTDLTGEVGADDLLDALEELRDAGAEAVQVAGGQGPGGPGAGGEGAGGQGEGGQGAGPVRVVASTSFLEREEGVEVDGTLLRAPYVFTVVGDPATLAAALAIPGGVTDNVEQQGGRVAVARPARVRVAALRALSTPRYARPSSGSGD